MKNFVRNGGNPTFTAPTGGVVSGSVYKIGSAIVVAGATAAVGVPFAGRTLGDFIVPAATSQAWTEGALVYWDDTAKVFTTTAASNQKAGYAIVAKLAAAATGTITLVPTI